jgi:omega-6 fatty acid desaturase (delta-12 desaturase)
MTQDDWRGIAGRFPRGSLRPITVILFVADVLLIAWSWTLGLGSGWQRQLAAWALLLLGLIHAYLILHEAVHGAVAKRAWLNELVGQLCGWLICLPFLRRQSNHLQHHHWAAHPTRDPENAGMIERFAVMTRQEEIVLEFLWRNWLPAIALNHVVGIWKAPFADRRKGNASRRIRKEVRYNWLYLAAYAVLAFVLVVSGKAADFLLWYVPAWVALLYFIELANLPHHAGAPLLDESSGPLPYWQQDQVSHDCGSLPVWSRLIILNFNLHTVHHRFPFLPWYELPKAQEISEALPASQRAEFKNEFDWALTHRRRPLLQLMGHFFDKRAAPRETL